MKIEVKIVEDNKFKKEDILGNMDKHVKCFLKKSKWLKPNNVTICRNELADVFEAGDNMTDEQYERLKYNIPFAYLYIDPDKDESWIDNWQLFSIINNFNIVVIRTYRMTRPAVDALLQNINDCVAVITVPYDRVSNEFDYEYIVLASNYDVIMEQNLFKVMTGDGENDN